MAEKLTVTLADFAALLPTLKPNQACSYGIAGHDAARVVVADAVTQASNGDTPIIARTRDFFAWPAGAGILMLDYDAPKDNAPLLDCRQLRDALAMACLPLDSAPAVWRPSASSCIHVKSGAELRGIRGQRLYLPVVDASDIERAGKVLFDRLWLAGYGRYELSGSGAWLVRSPIDASVFQPERLDFCGGAAVGAGLEQRLPDPVIFNSDAPYLDTRAALPDLDTDELARLADLRGAAKTPLLAEQARVKALWVAARVDQRLATLPEPARAAARPRFEATYREAVEGGRLAADFELTVKTKGRKVARRITVADALADKATWHDATCLDPMEPDYPDGAGRFVGWLNLVHKPPYITSQAHGGTRYHLGAESAAAESARPAGAESVAVDAPGTGLNPYRGTDDANADLLLGIHGADIRYCPPWDKWLLWTGSHWRIDARLDIDRLSADVPRSLRTRAITLTQEQQSLLERMAALLSQINADPAQRQGLTKEHSRLLARKKTIDDEIDWLLKLAGKLEGTAKRGCMLLATRHKVVVHHSDLDKSHFLLNASNGTVDLQSGKLRAHERTDLLTHDVEIPLNPTAAAPTWLQFLNSTFAGDADLIQFVQRAVGYSLTGDVREQMLLICHGVGSNGKSVFLNVLQKLLGALAFQAAPDLLMADKQRRHPTEQADLFGKRLVVCQETGEGRRFNETLVKQLTGGDTITARRMHEDFWQFKPTHKLWLSTNHKPEIRGTDHAIWRRIRLIPFNVKFTDDGPARKDPEMEAKLTAELPGILAWAVAGCLDWQRHGLKPPAAVASATADYQAEMDVLAAWLGECCIVGKRFEAKAADLYASYSQWCEQSGERPETQRKWGMRLTERGFLREQRRVGIVYLGIGVVDHREPCEPCEPEKAIFSLLDFSKSSYGKTAVEGSQGSHHSQTTSPPVEPAFEGRDVEEF